jgi:hypothetical protein
VFGVWRLAFGVECSNWIEILSSIEHQASSIKYQFFVFCCWNEMQSSIKYPSSNINFLYSLGVGPGEMPEILSKGILDWDANF